MVSYGCGHRKRGRLGGAHSRRHSWASQTVAEAVVVVVVDGDSDGDRRVGERDTGQGCVVKDLTLVVYGGGVKW